MSVDLDKTYCENKECPHQPRCGLSILNHKPVQYPIWTAHFAPNKFGTCKYFEPIKTKKGKTDGN